MILTAQGNAVCNQRTIRLVLCLTVTTRRSQLKLSSLNM